ncbi:MAG: divalent-cation tolerance protein CutA [Proteobacteria bacterium]|nr:divalent-cation tolerance protein CutA [Pseudomonadota bacterium]
MRLVISTAPVDAASDLARKIIEERLAACVNIVPRVKSIYIWEGRLEEDEEALMMAKTTAAGVERLSSRIKELHPYDVPEIISLKLDEKEGNPDYLAWVREMVGPS